MKHQLDTKIDNEMEAEVCGGLWGIDFALATSTPQIGSLYSIFLADGNNNESLSFVAEIT